MRKLFIIGNGFDLAHGLPTRYSDFHRYLQETYPEADEENESVPGLALGHHGDIEFHKGEAIGYLMNVLNRSSLENWSDFEDALGHLDFGDVFCSLMEELSGEGDPNPWDIAYRNEDTVSDLAAIVPLLTELFSDWINTIQIVRTRNLWNLPSLINPDQDMFLNFNYTRTLETIYGAKNVCHIHGVQGGHILVGHGEGALFSENQLSSYVGSEDGLEQIQDLFRKDTEGALRRNQNFFQSLQAGVSGIYSHGFSFSGVDEIYIQEICRRVNTTDLTWYLHDYDSDKHDKFKDVITRNGFKGSFDTFSI